MISNVRRRRWRLSRRACFGNTLVHGPRATIVETFEVLFFFDFGLVLLLVAVRNLDDFGACAGSGSSASGFEIRLT